MVGAPIGWTHSPKDCAPECQCRYIRERIHTFLVGDDSAPEKMPPGGGFPGRFVDSCGSIGFKEGLIPGVRCYCYSIQVAPPVRQLAIGLVSQLK